MLTFSPLKISINAVGSSTGEQAAFIAGDQAQPPVACCQGLNFRWRRNFSAMKDQNFQNRMSKHDTLLPSEGNGVANEPKANSSRRGFAPRPSLDKELDSQASFKAFIKRSIPSKKPSPALIQSIKDRIKIIEFPDK
ncbi:MAG: hypothetical protein AAGJ93_15665, partial [Bacteroidota bacterium]